jgi:hypothetical protein
MGKTSMDETTSATYVRNEVMERTELLQDVTKLHVHDPGEISVDKRRLISSRRGFSLCHLSISAMGLETGTGSCFLGRKKDRNTILTA